ncbi:hypothetical protein AK830_g9346 [Neonectria ditissima]|uniref:Uncharacterized protein n=1 Tax=Neonectria ditissima TaxID=78410 RepID=A0A0P7AS13_9HYPO|nr:hypothetical protein AK830_g9346 [Neonectria ditissima]
MSCSSGSTSPESQCRDNSIWSTISDLPTPPDSAGEKLSLSSGENAISSAHFTTPGPGFIIERNVAYPLGQIRVMATTLAYARQNGEFPKTTSSPMDTRALIEDYQHLVLLWQARGDESRPAPEAYNQLRVAIARSIMERDASLGNPECQAEAMQRVERYFRSLQQDRNYFGMANTMLQDHGVVKPTQLDLENVGEELCSVIENTIEETVSDATGPLRLNVGTFKDQNNILRSSVGELQHHGKEFEQHGKKLEQQNRLLNRQIGFHNHILEQQAKASNNLLSMFEPQAKNMQTTSEQLALVSGFVDTLSQVVMNLPITLDQAVHTSVQHQTQDAFKHILEAQKKAIHDLEQRSSEIRLKARESEDSKLRVGAQERNQRVHSSISGSRRRSKKGKERMQKIMKKVFGA